VTVTVEGAAPEAVELCRFVSEEQLTTYCSQRYGGSYGMKLDEKYILEHLTRMLNRLWIHMTVRIRFNIHTGTKGPVMNGEALF